MNKRVRKDLTLYLSLQIILYILYAFLKLVNASFVFILPFWTGCTCRNVSHYSFLFLPPVNTEFPEPCSPLTLTKKLLLYKPNPTLTTEVAPRKTLIMTDGLCPIQHLQPTFVYIAALCEHKGVLNCTEASPRKCCMCIAWQTLTTLSSPEASHHALPHPVSLYPSPCASYFLSEPLSLWLFVVLFHFFLQPFLSHFVYFLFSMQISIQSSSLWQSADIYFWFSSCCSFPRIKRWERWSCSTSDHKWVFETHLRHIGFAGCDLQSISAALRQDLAVSGH